MQVISEFWQLYTHEQEKPVFPAKCTSLFTFSNEIVNFWYVHLGFFNIIEIEGKEKMSS